MSVDSEKDLQGLKRAGRVVALTLTAMGEAVREGITTAELDQVAAACSRSMARVGWMDDFQRGRKPHRTLRAHDGDYQGTRAAAHRRLTPRAAQTFAKARFDA